MLDPTLLSATWCIEVSRVQKNTLYSFFAHYLHSAEVILNTTNWSKHVWGLFVFFDNEKYFYRLNFSKSWNLKKKDISSLKKRARVVMKVCQWQFAGWGWGQARKQDVQGARLHPVNTWASFSYSLDVDVQLDIRSATGHRRNMANPSVVCGYILFLDWTMCPSYILKSYQQGK